MLCGDLAILRLFTGDPTGARALARETPVLGTTSVSWSREYPLALALAVAFEHPAVARRALREYDEAATIADWPLGPETVAFYGGVAAAAREDSRGSFRSSMPRPMRRYCRPVLGMNCHMPMAPADDRAVIS